MAAGAVVASELLHPQGFAGAVSPAESPAAASSTPPAPAPPSRSATRPAPPATSSTRASAVSSFRTARRTIPPLSRPGGPAAGSGRRSCPAVSRASAWTSCHPRSTVMAASDGRAASASPIRSSWASVSGSSGPPGPASSSPRGAGAGRRGPAGSRRSRAGRPPAVRPAGAAARRRGAPPSRAACCSPCRRTPRRRPRCVRRRAKDRRPDTQQRLVVRGPGAGGSRPGPRTRSTHRARLPGRDVTRSVTGRN